MSAALAPKFCPGAHNLFFAIRPPADKVREIMEVAASVKTRIGGISLHPDRLHISLLALVQNGEVPPGLVEEAGEVAGSVRVQPMRVIFDRVVGGSNSALLRPSEPLELLRMFRERLGFALRNAGLDLHLDGRFSPHVTLLYGGQPMQEIEIEPITWTVEEFVLIDSHIGLTHHETAGRWPLKD